MITRRACLTPAIPLALGGLVCNGMAKGQENVAINSIWFQKHLTDIEKQSGGRLGVAFLDSSTGVHGGYRAAERFPMCSTFKLLAAAAVLARVDQKKEQLDRVVHYTPKDLVSYSPATEKHVGKIGMSVSDLCAAAITLSDNTAANLLLVSIGGPAGLTTFARTLRDEITRLDRNEPGLNEALPGDPRDTTTPAAMVSNLRALTLGEALSKASREQLTDWLLQSKTGAKRIRAGLPAAWKTGDKTGTGPRGTSNDLAITWPPGRASVLIAAYLTRATVNEARRDATIAQAAKAVQTALKL